MREGVTLLQASTLVAAGLETKVDVWGAGPLAITALGSIGKVWSNLHLGEGDVH